MQPDVLAAAADKLDGTLNNQSLAVLFTCKGKKLLFVGTHNGATGPIGSTERQFPGQIPASPRVRVTFLVLWTSIRSVTTAAQTRRRFPLSVLSIRTVPPCVPPRRAPTANRRKRLKYHALP
jgi:hypothetical protein